MALADVLARLEPLQRRAVRLVYVEGRSHREAADLLAVDRGAVAAALASAYTRIARAVGDDDGAHDVPLDLASLAEPARAFPATDVSGRSLPESGGPRHRRADATDA